jgi:mono/diheme cytochrome c family protein
MPSALRLILSAAMVLVVAPSAMATPAGAELFTRKGCIGCHTLKGHDGAEGQLGPDLSKIGKERDRETLIPWIRDPQAQKPGSAMPTLDLTLKEAEALADYLLSERPRKGKRR